ncbi:MAG: hypothetical protein NUV83_03230 [Candidatus Wolfebacteria bacterium]|nr:hypothetical protein [Candidatus Wolfebacteria bacterium]
MRKRTKGNGNGAKNGTKIGILVWKTKPYTSQQLKELTIADKIYDILLLAKSLQKEGAREIRLTLHLNQLCSSGRRISLEDEMVTRLYGALRSHGIEESTIHFI